MDSLGPPTWPNPKKQIFTQKICYTFLKKTILQKKHFPHLFERTDHPAQPPKNKFLPKKFLILPQKSIFYDQKKKKSYTLISYARPKKTNFPNENNFL